AVTRGRLGRPRAPSVRVPRCVHGAGPRRPGRRDGSARRAGRAEGRVMEILSYDFMRNALLAALLVGAVAPLVGIFLVQRRLSLIGDGLGHVALAGVAIGVLLDNQPILTALAAAVLAGVAVEVIRARGRTSGDIVLAVMFYGGIAA